MKSLSLLFFCLLTLSIKADASEEVNTQKLSDLIQPQSYRYPAQIVALKQVDLSSEMAGKVLSHRLFVGKKVNKNQTLVSLDCTALNLQKDQALAALNRLTAQKTLSQQQLNRAKKLVRIKSISNQELDEKQTTLDAAIANLEQQQVAQKIIEHSITQCVIKAPFAGIITQHLAQTGLYVTPGVSLLTLFDPASVELETQLPLSISATLSSAKNLSFQQNGQTYPVKIRTALPLVDAQTKQHSTRLSFKNKIYPLANSIGYLSWDGAQPYLPSQYIVRRNGRLGVLIAKEGKAKFHPLPEAVEGQNSPINLPIDSLIITDKLLTLKPNDDITRP